MTRHSRRCVMTSPRPALRLTTGRVGGAYHEGVMELGSEDRDLVHLDASSTPKTEADAYTAPLIQKIGAPSIAQIEKLIGELQEAKNLLESEGERIQREMVRYIKFAQLASLGHVTFNRSFQIEVATRPAVRRATCFTRAFQRAESDFRLRRVLRYFFARGQSPL